MPHEILLVPEESRPRMPWGRVGVLVLQFVPMIDIGIVHGNFGSHLGQLADDQFAAAVTCISDILTVARTGYQDACTRRCICPCYVARRG